MWHVTFWGWTHKQDVTSQVLGEGGQQITLILCHTNPKLTKKTSFLLLTAIWKPLVCLAGGDDKLRYLEDLFNQIRFLLISFGCNHSNTKFENDCKKYTVSNLSFTHTPDRVHNMQETETPKNTDNSFKSKLLSASRCLWHISFWKFISESVFSWSALGVGVLRPGLTMWWQHQDNATIVLQIRNTKPARLRFCIQYSVFVKLNRNSIKYWDGNAMWTTYNLKKDQIECSVEKRLIWVRKMLHSFLSGLFISISFQVVDFESLLSLDLLALTHNFPPTSSDDWICLTLIWA